MKNFVKILLSTLLTILLNHSLSYADIVDSTARGVVLMDAKSGIILYQKNMNTPLPPASTTKLMTTLLVLENTKLDDLVTVDSYAEALVGNGNSSIGIQAGEKISVKDLLYGLILESGNDCAVALADHISGSEQEFTKLMNKRAKELGCTNTNFLTASGLYEDGHATSAYDLALISRELIKYPVLHDICSTVMYKLEKTETNNAERFANNGNLNFLQISKNYYENMLFAKNGWTPESKHSYVAAAEKDGRDLIAVILSDDNKNYYAEAKTLFEYGFNKTKIEKVFSKGDVLSNVPITNDITVPVIAQNDFYINNTDNIKDSVSLQVSSPTVDITALDSIKKNEILSKVNIISNGTILGTVNLLSSKDLVLKSLNSNTTLNSTTYSNSWIITVSICIASIIILLLIRRSYLKRLRRK